MNSRRLQKKYRHTEFMKAKFRFIISDSENDFIPHVYFAKSNSKVKINDS